MPDVLRFAVALCTWTLVALPLLSQQDPLTPEQRTELAREGDRLEKEGDDLTVSQKWAEAVEKYEQALVISRRLIPAGHIGESRLMYKIVEYRFYLGQPAQADPVLERAIALLQKLFPVEAGADHARALRFFDLHEALCRKINRSQSAGRCIALAARHSERLYPPDKYPDGHLDPLKRTMNAGILLLEAGDIAGARVCYVRATELAHKLYPPEKYPDGDPTLATVLNNRGYFHSACREYDEALKFYLASLDMRRRLFPTERWPHGHGIIASSLRNIGDTLHAMGQLKEARRHTEYAIKMAHALKLDYDEALYRNNLGLLLHEMRDLDGALAEYRAALTVIEKERNPESRRHLQPLLNNLGCLMIDQKDYALAKEYLNRSLELTRTLYVNSSFGGNAAEAQLLMNLGELFARDGDADRGTESSAAAATWYARQLSEIAEREAEDVVLGLVVQTPGADGVLSVSRNRPELDGKAYAAVWQNKGLLTRVLEFRSELRRTRSTAAGQATWEKLQNTRYQLSQVAASPAKTENREERLRDLTAQKEALERQLMAALPRGTSSLRDDPAGPASLITRLPNGAAFVDVVRYIDWSRSSGPVSERAYATLPRRYAAFVLVPGERPARIELGDAKVIDAHVRDWRAAAGLQGDRGEATARSAIAALCGGALAEADTAALRGLRKVSDKVAGTALATTGTDLRRAVWEPIAKALPAGTRTVYLCPDGDLARLPWEALPGSAADRVLLEEFAFARVPHGPFLLRRLTADAKPAGPGSVFALGAVDYGRGAGGYPRWPALPGTGRELDLLAAVAGGVELTRVRGADATVARTVAGLSGVRIAHIATHGYFAGDLLRDDVNARAGAVTPLRQRNPLAYCGLVLAGAEESGGMLTAETVAGLALDNLDLAVLSACETGLGHLSAREGSFGLPRAFHLAGCRNVVASLWPVDDDATAAVMAGFYYRLLTKKESPLDALRGAQLGVFRHPDLIPELSGRRGADPRTAALVKTAGEKPADSIPGPRAAMAMWAAFHLSGSGR